LARDLNLSEKQVELSGSRPRIFYTKLLQHVSFKIAKMNSKNFSLKKMIWSCVMMILSCVMSLLL
jgi:hypothetical protein